MQPEAGDEMAGLHGKPVEAEVGEAGIARGLLMPGEEAAAEHRIVVAGERAGQRQPRAGQRIAAFAAWRDEEKRRAVVALQVPGVGGEVGKERIGSPASVVATVTSEAKGAPPASRVPRLPVAARRRTCLAVKKASLT